MKVHNRGRQGGWGGASATFYEHHRPLVDITCQARLESPWCHFTPTQQPGSTASFVFTCGCTRRELSRRCLTVHEMTSARFAGLSMSVVSRQHTRNVRHGSMKLLTLMSSNASVTGSECPFSCVTAVQSCLYHSCSCPAQVATSRCSSAACVQS